MTKTLAIFWLLMATVLFGAGMANAAPVLTADPLTKLPLDPATVGMLGNQPISMDPATVCKSKMAANVYSAVKSNFPTTNAWYAAHLTGLKHSHGYSNGSAKDGYYSADGTTLIIILASAGADGAPVDTFSITYYSFQPGLAEKAIVGILHDNITC